MESRNKTELLDLPFNINDPEFLSDNERIVFKAEDNAFIYDLKSGSIQQLTHIKSGSNPEKSDKKSSEKNGWIESENLKLLEVVNQRKEKEESSKEYRESIKEDEDLVFYLNDRDLANLEVSSNAKYVSFSLIERERGDNTDVPDYVDESGYTKNLSARSKVGDMEYTAELALYNIEKDTVFILDVS